MTDTLPARWALDKAAKLCGWKDWPAVPDCDEYSDWRGAIIAFARYIEEHEPEPENKFLVMAREVVALWFKTDGDEFESELAKQYRAGRFDDELKLAADYLREQWEKGDA